MRLKMKAGVLMAMMLCIESPAFPAGSSAISGTVRDDSGQTVPGTVLVQARRLADATSDASGRPVVQYNTAFGVEQSTANGNFSFAGLPEGKYYICAYSEIPGYLSNCKWTAGAQLTELKSGTIVAGLALVLRRGSVVQINVNDAAKLITPHQTLSPQTSGHYFSASVKNADGYFEAANYISDSGSQHIYAITVPSTVTVELLFDSDLTVRDASGSVIPTRVPSGITLSGPSQVTVAVSLK